MGIGIALILHLLLYAILAAVLSLISFLIRRLLPSRKSALARAMVIAPFVLAGIPLTAFVGIIAWENIAPPGFLYAEVFGRSPMSTVDHLQGYSEATNDGQEIFLSFGGADAALNQTLATGPFDLRGKAEGEDAVPLPGDPPPLWWRAGNCLDRSVYAAKRLWKWDDVIITQCRSDDTIYVQARWIE